MDTLKTAKATFLELIEAEALDRNTPIAVRPLEPQEAIGGDVDDSFVIKRGVEKVIEAVFREHRGQAFTDRPSQWEGSLKEILTLDLASVRNRAVFVASLNAVLSALGKSDRVLHCKDEDPMRCGPEISSHLFQRFGPLRVGLIGLQPSLLKALVLRFGVSSVSLVDLNPDNINKIREGVEVWHGGVDLSRLVDACEVGLATGSSVVNGTLDDIRRQFREEGKPLIVFGNTISGIADILGLDHLCPFGGSNRNKGAQKPV